MSAVTSARVEARLGIHPLYLMLLSMLLSTSTTLIKDSSTDLTSPQHREGKQTFRSPCINYMTPGTKTNFNYLFTFIHLQMTTRGVATPTTQETNGCEGMSYPWLLCDYVDLRNNL